MTKGFIKSPDAEIVSKTETQPIKPLVIKIGGPVRLLKIIDSFYK